MVDEENKTSGAAGPPADEWTTKAAYRSKASVVPSAMKTTTDDTDSKEPVKSIHGIEYAIFNEHSVGLASSKAKVGEESIRPMDKEDDGKVAAEITDAKISLTHPIPVVPKSPEALEADDANIGKMIKKEESDDSITKDNDDVQSAAMAKPHEWTVEDEEAGGLPSPQEAGSRVYRAVRQLLCCGVKLQRASEDEISYNKDYGI